MNNMSFEDMETVNTDFVEITEDFLVSGMTSGCGINKEQFQLLGIEYPAPKGWKQSLIGKKISKETAQKFCDLKGVHKKKDRNEILSKNKEKLATINMTYWESVTLYQLIKKEYCGIPDILKRETHQVYKDYNKLMDKLENAIANTLDDTKD